jgi:hypothetical protein
MIEEKLVTPPIRSALMEEKEPNANTPARDWWLHWNSVTLRGNQNAADIDALEAQAAELASGIAALDDEVSHMLRPGTHAARLAAAPDPIGALWMETDRNNVVYQAQTVAGSPAWVYVTGTMWGTFSPDQRPADLGGNDAGFDFRTTVAPSREFRWSGSAWVEIGSGYYILANGSASPLFTLSPVPIPGMLLTLTRPGVYSLRTACDMTVTGADGVLLCLITVNGTGLPGGYAIVAGPSGTRATASTEARYVAAAGDVVTVAAFKTGGTGSSTVGGSNSMVSATWISA